MDGQTWTIKQKARKPGLREAVFPWEISCILKQIVGDQEISPL